MTVDILLLCTHNSARSVLTEGMLSRLLPSPQRPLGSMDRADLETALVRIGRS